MFGTQLISFFLARHRNFKLKIQFAGQRPYIFRVLGTVSSEL